MCKYLSGLILILTSSVAPAESTIDPALLQKVKAATVFVKTQWGPFADGGSGFVIGVEGEDTVLVATNQHVIGKPKVSDLATILALKSLSRMTLEKLHTSLVSRNVTVVFRSGSMDEQSLKAEVETEDVDADLGVLRVRGLKSRPTPLSYESPPEMSETMSLFILGFPFGEALSSQQRNPALTVGKGSISSLHRNQEGRIVKVQIDGALNPGNSGGPLVDANGNLVGIAVRTFPGSNIGLAIHPNELKRVMDGGVGRFSLTGRQDFYEIVAALNDPLHQIKSLKLYYVPESILTNSKTKNAPVVANAPGHRELEFVIEDHRAHVKLPFKTEDKKFKEITVQASFVNPQGEIVYSEPQVLAVAAKEKSLGTNSPTVVREENPVVKSETLKPSTETDQNQQKNQPEGSVPTPGAPPPGDSPEIPSAWADILKKMLGATPESEVTGKLQGLSLIPNEIQFNGIWLYFRQTEGELADLEVSLMLPKKLPEMAGQKIIVNGAGRNIPHVRSKIQIKNEPTYQSKVYHEYLLILEMGEYDEMKNTIAGKLYLCFPNREEGFLTGTFIAKGK